MAKDPCSEILEKAYQSAETRLKKSFITDAEVADRIAFVALCPGNRAGSVLSFGRNTGKGS